MKYLKERIIHIHNLTHRIRIKTMGSLFNNRLLLFAPKKFRFLFESLTVQLMAKAPISLSHRSSDSFGDRTISLHLRRRSHD